jgi:hypothetical protein
MRAMTVFAASVASVSPMESEEDLTASGKRAMMAATPIEATAIATAISIRLKSFFLPIRDLLSISPERSGGSTVSCPGRNRETERTGSDREGGYR